MNNTHIILINTQYIYTCTWKTIHIILINTHNTHSLLACQSKWSLTDRRDGGSEESGSEAAGGRHPQPGPQGDQGPAGDRGQPACECQGSRVRGQSSKVSLTLLLRWWSWRTSSLTGRASSWCLTSCCPTSLRSSGIPSDLWPRLRSKVTWWCCWKAWPSCTTTTSCTEWDGLHLHSDSCSPSE